MATVMLHEWRTVTFLHWRYDPATVSRLLPAGLAVETFDGAAWVGLVPFAMEVRAPGVPAMPWLSHFPETNVRTYVRGPDGRTGIWFLSLDAARLAAVISARLTYGLPYYWSAMSVSRADRRVAYRSHRRWPGRSGPASRLTVEVGPRLSAAPELDHWLTERHRLYTVIGGRLASATAEHPPWPLRAASAIELADDLVVAAGLPRRVGDPLVHHADGVSVRVGSWHWIGRHGRESTVTAGR